MNRKKYLAVSAALFCALLLGFFIAFLLVPDREFSATENRNLQTLPQATLSSVESGRFETSFENYVNDQFPLRDFFIQVKTTTDRLLGKTKSGNVFLGKDHTLIEDFVTPKISDTRTIRQSITDFSQRFGDRPTHVMIVPTAVGILPEKLPLLADCGDQNAYLDEMNQYLQKGGMDVIDLRAAFTAAKEDTLLYYRTDHHWTTDAAYLAFREYAAHAGIDISGMTYDRLPISDNFTGTLSATSGYAFSGKDEIYIYRRTDRTAKMSVYYAEEQYAKSSCYQTDFLSGRDQYAVFLGGNHPLIKIKTDCPQDKTLLVIKDSYANCFIPFLAQCYREIYVVDPRYYYENLGTLVKTADIDEFLFLYNANTLAQDTTLSVVLNDALC